MTKATILSTIGLGEAGANTLDAIAEEYGARLDAQDVTDAIESNADNVAEIGEDLIRRLYDHAIENALDEAGIENAEERYQLSIRCRVNATKADAPTLHVQFPDLRWEEVNGKTGLVCTLLALRLAREVA